MLRHLTPIQRDVLMKARERVVRGWTQAALARNTAGQPVPPWNPAAVYWCPFGALEAVCEITGKRRDFLGRVVRHLDVRAVHDVIWWNDRLGRTQAEAVALFDAVLDGTPAK